MSSYLEKYFVEVQIIEKKFLRYRNNGSGSQNTQFQSTLLRQN